MEKLQQQLTNHNINALYNHYIAHRNNHWLILNVLLHSIQQPWNSLLIIQLRLNIKTKISFITCLLIKI